MTNFKPLIELIGKAVIDFNDKIPGIQKRMLDDVLLLAKKLDVKDDRIKVAGSNLRLLSQLQSSLQKILLNPECIKSIKSYVSNFDQVVSLQNSYFRQLENKFQPPKLVKEIKKQAIQSVVNSLTETGLNANIVDKISGLMRQATTTGGSYSTLSNQLTNFIVNNESGEGQLLRYTKQMSTDALNQFSGQYSQLVSSDLGFEWYRYSGSNIETSRPFCLACTDRKFFHISELPKILKGDFDEFVKQGGKVNKKTGLPEGMIDGTDISNFMTYRGGYNCGHQWRPVSSDLVPQDIQQRVYASQDYKTWAQIHRKQAKAPTAPPVPFKQVDKKKKDPEKTSIVSKIKENNKYDLDKLQKRGIVFYDEVTRLMPEDVKIISSTGDRSFYTPDNKTIVIGGGVRSKNEYYRKKIMLHEGGHAIHPNKEIITTTKVSEEFKAFYNGLKDTIKGKEKEIDAALWELSRKHRNDETKGEQLIILHDTLGGLTRGKHGSGHSKTYYKTGNLSEMEVFAHAITLSRLDNEFADFNPTIKALTDAMKQYGDAVLKGD